LSIIYPLQPLPETLFSNNGFYALELLLGLCRFGSRKAKKGELRIRDKKYLLKELRIIANTGRSFLLQP